MLIQMMNKTRKATILFALLMQCLVMRSQQVQRMFMGCSFGDKMEVVLDSLQSRGIKVVACKDALVIDAAKKPITYNGVTWNYVCLNFFDNQFYTISFTSDDTQKKRAEMKSASVCCCVPTISQIWSLMRKSTEDFYMMCPITEISIICMSSVMC